jgi:hypothetical protein
VEEAEQAASTFSIPSLNQKTATTAAADNARRPWLDAREDRRLERGAEAAHGPDLAEDGMNGEQDREVHDDTTTAAVTADPSPPSRSRKPRRRRMSDFFRRANDT